MVNLEDLEDCLPSLLKKDSLESQVSRPFLLVQKEIQQRESFPSFWLSPTASGKLTRKARMVK